MLQRLKSAYQRLGPFGLARRVALEAYSRTVRPLLPRTPVRYSGTEVAIYRHAGDAAVASILGPLSHTDDIPSYEQTLLAGLRAHVRPGDRITIVGGGAGVTAVVAAQCAGETGRVVCFEGSARQARLVRQTAALNGLAERVSVRHAIVGPAIGVYGEAGGAEHLAAAALPPCDVLELDCEGSEIEILQQLTLTPRVILVETHGMYGASSAHCAELLRARGYRVQDLGLAEPRVAAYCEAEDIRVLSGERVAAT